MNPQMENGHEIAFVAVLLFFWLVERRNQFLRAKRVDHPTGVRLNPI